MVLTTETANTKNFDIVIDDTTTTNINKKKSIQIKDTKDNPHEVTALQDLIAGSVAGTSSIVVGHPFDTIKVRLQTSTKQTAGGRGGGVFRSFGGFTSLFRGIGAPLSSAAIVNAIIFSSFGISSRLWDSYINKEQQQETTHGVISSEGAVLIEHTPMSNFDDATKHVGRNFCCGAFAGFTQSFVICPMEHVKCRLQVQHGIGSSDYVYKNSWDATHQIMTKYGIKGLFRGMASTCWREVPGFGVYFASYDILRDNVSKVFPSQKDEHGFLASFLAGGFSGSLTWACTYPFDVIKTRVQTAPLTSHAFSPELKTLAVGRSLVKENGWKYLYRGFGVTILRAFPVNAIIFPTYFYTIKQLQIHFG